MFCNLTPEALADYDGIGIMMSHARGAKLFSEGDPARNVFVICFGQVKISSTSRETVTRLLNQFRRDQWITIKGTSLTIVKPEQLERLTA